MRPQTEQTPPAAQVTTAGRGVAAAVESLLAGQAVVLVHEPTRTAHLIASARHVRIDAVELMAAHGRGVLRAAMTAQRMRRLRLRGLAASPATGALYAAPVDRVGHNRAGVLADRLETAHALASPATRPDGLISPGHVFPVEARPAGSAALAQPPDAACDLVRLAGGDGVALYTDVDHPRRVEGNPAERERLARELGAVVLASRDLTVDQERPRPAVHGGLRQAG